MDAITGESRQLTNATALDPHSLALSPDDRYLYYFDGPALNSITLSALHAKPVYRVPEGATAAGLTVASDGSVLFAEAGASQSRVVRVGLRNSGPVFDVPGNIELVMARPKRPQLAFRAGGALWLANADGTGRRQLKTMPGVTGEALWSPTGRTLLYLHIPDDPKQLISLREYTPDDDTDARIADTSQFGAFSCNADASVFAGASRSKASAYVLLLNRAARRELALCEHRASDPAMVVPVFSPDSQSVYFVSDRHGKPAVYRIDVKNFVEATGGGG